MAQAPCLVAGGPGLVAGAQRLLPRLGGEPTLPPCRFLRAPLALARPLVVLVLAAVVLALALVQLLLAAVAGALLGVLGALLAAAGGALPRELLMELLAGAVAFAVEPARRRLRREGRPRGCRRRSARPWWGVPRDRPPPAALRRSGRRVRCRAGCRQVCRRSRSHRVGRPGRPARCRRAGHQRDHKRGEQEAHQRHPGVSRAFVQGWLGERQKRRGTLVLRRS